VRKKKKRKEKKTSSDVWPDACCVYAGWRSNSVARSSSPDVKDKRGKKKRE